MKFLNNLAPALAPIYSILKIIDIIQAIVNCINAIPKSIMPPNPQPIIKCLQKLVKAFAELIPLIPPLAYVRMVVDIVQILQYLVNDLLSLTGIIDRQMQRIKTTLRKGMEQVDQQLVISAECARDNLNQEITGLLEIIEVIGKFMSLIFTVLDTISALCPPLQDKVDEWRQAITGATDQTGGSAEDALGFMQLTPIITILKILSVILAYIAQVGSAIVGLNFDPEAFTPPDITLSNA